MKILVCGSRSISDVKFIEDTIEAANFHITSVVVGDARGVDTVARKWAEKHGIPYDLHYADWDKFGKSAGFRRNREMAQTGIDGCIAIWDGVSHGTKDMIDVIVTTVAVTPCIIVRLNRIPYSLGDVPFVELEECPF